MSCKPDPNLTEEDADEAITRTAQKLHDLIESILRPSKVTGIAKVNLFAWAIDEARNTLPTDPAVSTVQGLGRVDRWGEPVNHVVALTDAEIEQLHDNHLYAVSGTKKPRRGDWAPDAQAAHAYHTDRAALFAKLLPPEQEDAAEPDAIGGDPDREPRL